MSEFEDMAAVFAVFNNESAAVGALAGLEHWAGTSKEIRLGSVGAIYIEHDEMVTELVRKADKGPLVSGAMGLAKTFLGPFVLVGNVVGGVAKSFSDDETVEAPEAFKMLAQQMEAGYVTLVVMASTADEADAYRAQLEAMCGQVTLYEVPKEVLEDAATAVEAAQAEAEAEEKAAKEAEKAAKKEEKEEKRRAEEDEDAA